MSSHFTINLKNCGKNVWKTAQDCPVTLFLLRQSLSKPPHIRNVCKQLEQLFSSVNADFRCKVSLVEMDRVLICACMSQECPERTLCVALSMLTLPFTAPHTHLSLSLSVCVYLSISLSLSHTHTHMHARTRAHIHTHTHTCMPTHGRAHIHTHRERDTHNGVSVHVCVYLGGLSHGEKQ